MDKKTFQEQACETVMNSIEITGNRKVHLTP